MIYTYKCDECDIEFVEEHGMNETPKVRCHICKKEARKVIGAVPVHFKGNGFYKTDY